MIIEQNDIRFIRPPGGAIGLNELTVKQYSLKDGALTILSAKGAEPHYVYGNNLYIRVGRKRAGRHSVAILTAAEPFKVKYKKEELAMSSGVYYVGLSDGSADTPLFQ